MKHASPAQIAAAIAVRLDAAGIGYRVHEHVPVRTIAEARAQVPELTVGLLKTVAFAIKGTPRVVLAAVAADDDVDYKALAAAVGCTRRALRLLPASEVAAELGFEVGGLGPFALGPGQEVVIDDRLDDACTVRCGAGLCTRTVELALGALATLGNARRAPIARAGRPYAGAPLSC